MLVNWQYLWILHNNWWRSPSIWGKCLATTSTLALLHCYLYSTMLLVIKVPILELHWPKIPAQHCDTEVELHWSPPIQHTDMSHSWRHIPCSILGSHLQNQAVTSCFVSFPVWKPLKRDSSMKFSFRQNITTFLTYQTSNGLWYRVVNETLVS